MEVVVIQLIISRADTVEQSLGESNFAVVRDNISALIHTHQRLIAAIGHLQPTGQILQLDGKGIVGDQIVSVGDIDLIVVLRLKHISEKVSRTILIFGTGIDGHPFDVRAGLENIQPHLVGDPAILLHAVHKLSVGCKDIHQDIRFTVRIVNLLLLTGDIVAIGIVITVMLTHIVGYPHILALARTLIYLIGIVGTVHAAHISAISGVFAVADAHILELFLVSAVVLAHIVACGVIATLALTHIGEDIVPAAIAAAHIGTIGRILTVAGAYISKLCLVSTIAFAYIGKDTVPAAVIAAYKGTVSRVLTITAAHIFELCLVSTVALAHMGSNIIPTAVAAAHIVIADLVVAHLVVDSEILIIDVINDKSQSGVGASDTILIISTVGAGDISFVDQDVGNGRAFRRHGHIHRPYGGRNIQREGIGVGGILHRQNMMVAAGCGPFIVGLNA